MIKKILSKEIVTADDFTEEEILLIRCYESNMKEMIKAYENYRGVGVIASKVVPDPSRYGVLIVEEHTNRILKFLEKSE